MVTGYNADTPRHIMTGSGMLFKNWVLGVDTLASAILAKKCLGATQGGVKFDVVPTMRTLAVDGVLGESTLVAKEGAVVTLVGNLLEITANNIKMAIPGSISTVDPVTGYTTIESENRMMQSGDFIGNITLVGIDSGSNRPVVIQIFNALSIGTFTLATMDKKEAVIPMSFKGHISPTSGGKDPFLVDYPLVDAAIPTSITLAKGTSTPVGGVTNVAIPDPGDTDTTGAVTGWVTGTANKIKLTVVDDAPATSTITIGGTAYTSGADYTITSAVAQTVIITTTEEGMATNIRTLTISVTAAA